VRLHELQQTQGRAHSGTGQHEARPPPGRTAPQPGDSPQIAVGAISFMEGVPEQRLLVCGVEAGIAGIPGRNASLLVALAGAVGFYPES